ncbi:TMEM165/GDT1 family protein [Candidatus Woesearchaeota archaeon]|nr:TMEM165/GDT1 family protein [Candidatus Woesearchaeota archaeon]
MFQDFFIPFLTIGLAEFGDKTQLAVLGLSTKTKKHLPLILGVVLAFILTDGLAIILGDWISNFVPMRYIRTFAGVVFIVFGIIILMNTKEEKTKYELKNPFISTFLLVSMMEMGDKTQIAAALFATKFNPVLVFAGVIAALLVLSLLAVYAGKFIAKKVDKKIISKIAGILFILIGVSSFVF